MCRRPAEATLAGLKRTQSDPLIAESVLICEARPEMHYLLGEWKHGSTEGGMRGRLEKTAKRVISGLHSATKPHS